MATALHAVLSHLEQSGSYARMLFIDFSSAFITVLPHRLADKLLDIGLPYPTCLWIKEFLSGRTQRVPVGPHLSTTISISTGSPQGCVLSPLLYSLYTYDCTPAHHSNTTDDTTVVGLISEGDESAYRDEARRLSEWCRKNNLLLHTAKTKELVIDFRKRAGSIQPLSINGVCVERVTDFCFLGVNISEDLTWKTHTAELTKRPRRGSAS